MRNSLEFLLALLGLLAVWCSPVRTSCLLSNATNCPCGEAMETCCYRVEENQSPGVVFGNVYQVPYTDVIPFLDDPGLSFALDDQNKPANITSNGSFFIDASLDRENTSCFTTQFLISSSSDPGGRRFVIAIHVLDVNDNAPIFTVPSPYVEEVQERINQDPNQPLFCTSQLIAVDSDIGQNGTISYSILTPPEFSVIYTDKICIYSTLPIDHELNQTFTLILLAMDNGVPMQRESNITIIINITDINDNPPVFMAPSQSTHVVLENATVGTPVVTYVATDRDSGSNAIIDYVLIQNLDYFPFVLINNTLYINSSLDADSNGQQAMSFPYSIRAINPGSAQSSTLSNEMILIEGVNDNTPNIELFFNTAIIEGNQTDNHRLRVIQLTDEDSDDPISIKLLNGSEYLQLEDLPPLNFFSLVTKLGVIIDREENPFIFVTLEATDSGTPPRTSTRSFNITVLDINDNAPTLSQTNFTISENYHTSGTIIHLFDYFVDPDLGNNGTLNEFNLLSSSPQNSPFIIQKKGDITIEGNLNSDMSHPFTLVVSISDKGTPPLSSTVTLHIVISDSNDPPVFVDGGALFLSILENQPPNTRVGEVLATDSDKGNNSLLTYSLEDNTYFNITRDTGIIYSRESFDREAKANYSVVVVATDRGDPPLSTNVTLTIHILDANDNVPRFNQTSYTFNISSTDTVVGQVYASDRDTGENAEIIYQLSATDYFTINSNGIISVLPPLPGGNDTTYFLNAYCYNLNSSLTNSSAWIKITVEFPSSLKLEDILTYAGAAAGGLLLAIFFLSCLICCVCCYRRRYQSRDLYKAPSSPISALNSVPRKPSLRSIPSAGGGMARYEEANGIAFRGMTKSPTVNFSEESEVRFYNRNQSLKKSESATYKIQMEELEMKNRDVEKLESPQIPTKEIMEDTKVSSPCLSDDLSSSPSMSTDLSHIYHQHTAAHQAPPVLREELLKKHDREYAAGSMMSPSRFPTAMIEEPMDNESIFDGGKHIPPTIQSLLAHNHSVSNQSITAPVSHYVSQTTGSMDSSPSQYSRGGGGGGMNHTPIGHHHPHHHHHHNSVPAVYKSGSGGHLPISPPNYRDQYYEQHMPTRLNGTSLGRYSSSSSSSPHHSDYPYTRHHSTSRDFQEPPPPPHHLLHNGHTSPEIYRSRHLPHTLGHMHIPPRDHPYQQHPLIHAQEKLHMTGPPPGGSPHVYDPYEDDDDETGTIASSVLDQYLQFHPPPLRHDFLSLSVDDVKLSSTDNDNKRIRHNHYAS